MSDTPRSDEESRTTPREGVPVVELAFAEKLERELNAAIMFIKDLNATTAQHGRVYRARCGKFLRTALKPKT